MRRFLLPAVVGVLALALGVGLGQMNAKTEIVERTVEVEKTVEITPPACIEALDLAAEGFGYTADFADVTSKAFTAIGNFDVAAFDPLLVEMNDLTEKVSGLAPRLAPLSSACRAAA